jgi:hypothetical protein
MSKLSTHFFHEDFVPKYVYKQYGDKSIWFISPFMINYAEFLWMRFGKQVIINNWKDGGLLEHRGFRPISYTGGGDLSQHRMKLAIDTNVVSKTPEEVYKDIQDNFSIYAKVGLTTVENIKFTTGKVVDDLSGWNHGDGRTTGQDTLLIVDP